MKDELFDELMGAAQEALEHSQGKRELRTTVLGPRPKPMRAREVKSPRTRTRMSQSVFAHHLNVSHKTVQAWEAGRRIPDAAALKLLRIAQAYPAIVFAASTSRSRVGPIAALPGSAA